MRIVLDDYSITVIAVRKVILKHLEAKKLSHKLASLKSQSKAIMNDCEA